MKRLVTAVVLLALLLCVSIYSLHTLRQGVGEVERLAQGLRYDTPARELEAKSQELFRFWNEKERVLVVFVRHDTLDEVTELLSRLPSLARYEDYGSFYSGVDAVLARLEDLLESAEPSYRNLL